MISAVQPRDLPADGRPEIALAGRSNVGKSSLINALVRKDIARTSASPGKTRQVNVYRVRPAAGAPFYLIDLPGYGHAGGGERARREFAALTSIYFAARRAPAAGPGSPQAGAGSRAEARSPLCGVILAIDARHPGMAGDVEAYGWLHTLGVPFLLVATKTDKLSQSERAKLARTCLETFGEAPLCVSAQTGTGLDELWQQIRLLSSGGSS